jgi:Ser/Thr protein kinase RdoA (MazF antagonist)
VHPDDRTTDAIRVTLREHWHLRPSAVAPMPAGWMSRAWAVRDGDDLYVARLVDAIARQPFETGLAAAAYLRENGIVIGEPVRNLAGSLTAADPVGTVGLVRRVPGDLLDGADPVDQQWWGDRLAAAHRALDGFTHRGLQRWHWLHPDAAHLAVEPWLRPAVADAVAAMTRLTVADRLTYGVLHGDPAPEAFVVDGRTGRTGLLDWGPCGTGPLVYDLAAAVAYAGGPGAADELVDAYVAGGVVVRDEVDAALPVLLRFRWAVQADWYARRLAVGASARDVQTSTGVPRQTRAAEPDGDRAGLAAAREALEAPCC